MITDFLVHFSPSLEKWKRQCLVFRSHDARGRQCRQAKRTRLCGGIPADLTFLFLFWSSKKEKEVHLPFVFRKCIPIFSEILFILVGETNSILFGVNHSPSLEKVQHNYWWLLIRISEKNTFSVGFCLTHNARFCKIAALSRVDNICVFLPAVARVERAWKPQPRKAANTLCAICGQRVSQEWFTEIIYKFLGNGKTWKLNDLPSPPLKARNIGLNFIENFWK